MNLTFNNRQFQALDASSVANALEMLRDGCERQKIAAFLDVPLWLLGNWIRLDEDAKAARAAARAKIKADPRTKGLDEAGKATALEMLGAGLSLRAAARTLAVDRHNFARWATLNPAARDARAAGKLVSEAQRLDAIQRFTAQAASHDRPAPEAPAPKAARNRIEPAKKPKALAMLRAEAPVEVAKFLRISRPSVSDWIARDPEAKAAWDTQAAPKRERRAKALEMLQSGATRKEVAEFLGITRGGLDNWMARHPEAQGAWEAQLAPLPEQRARAIQLIRAGATRKAIAGALGVADPLLAAHWMKTDAEAQAASALRNALKPHAAHAPQSPRKRARGVAASFDEAAVADALKAWESSRNAA